MVEYSRFARLPGKIRLATRDFLKDLETKPVIAIIFGSYANYTFSSSSDIDIMLVFQTIKTPKTIEDTAKVINLKTSTKISPVYMAYNEFNRSFHNSASDFFKNLKKNKLILVGIEWWRQMMDEETCPKPYNQYFY
jgi:predicted nucleotidyltransferase